MKQKIKEKEVKASITIAVNTYYSGSYRNTSVTLNIPKEAANIIMQDWSRTEGNLDDKVKALYLAENQSALCVIKIDGEIVAKVLNMNAENTVIGEIAKFEK